MQLQVYKCRWCSKHLFETGTKRQARSDRKFCSASCRGKYNRWLHNLSKYEKIAIKAVQEIAGYLEHPAAAARAAEGLRLIADAIEIEAAAAGLRVVE